MTRRRLAPAAIAVALAMLLAACGSGGGNEDGAGQDPTNGGADNATESAANDTEPADTTTSTTTTTATSTTTTTAPTTTETPEVTRPSIEIPTSWTNDRDEIFGRYLLYWAALDAAIGPPFADPDDPITRPILEDVLKPKAMDDIVETIQAYQDQGRMVVWPEDSIEEHVLRIPKVQPLSKQEGRKVLIQDCWIWDFDYYLTDGTFDETEEGFGLFNATLEVVDGKWQILANVEQGPDDVGYAWCEEVASYK